MFTGIISHTGTFEEYRKGKREIVLKCADLAGRLSAGESLSVNGVCLSLSAEERSALLFHLSRETLATTNLGSLRRSDLLNLELPATLSTPLGGHLVTGHIDARGEVLRVMKRGEGKRMVLSFPDRLRPYFIPKGSVAVNGVSLTVAQILPSSFEVELIPITLENTNLGRCRRGDRVNIECDIIGKYVYNWVSKVHPENR